jgi:hypothetical protein
MRMLSIRQAYCRVTLLVHQELLLLHLYRLAAKQEEQIFPGHMTL